MPEELKALYGFMQDGRGRNPLTEKPEAAVNRVRRNRPPALSGKSGSVPYAARKT